MSENEEEVNFLDSVLGGEESHSPEENEQGKQPVPETEPETDDGDELIPDDDPDSLQGEDLEESDSVNDEGTPPEQAQAKAEADAEAERQQQNLRNELETYKKRLHDTQEAMHKATSDRARLEKELSELKAKQESEDDWFSDSDKERVESIQTELKKTQDEIDRRGKEKSELQEKSAAVQWDAAAAAVIKEHPDFEKVVYDELTPLLDKETGNAMVKAEWDALKDKSPASVYAFAKSMLDLIEFRRDPEAYKRKLRGPATSTPKPGNETPTGKAGLDMLPSADLPADAAPSGDVSFVDAVFG